MLVAVTGQLIGILVFGIVNRSEALGIHVVAPAKRSASQDAQFVPVTYEPKKIEVLGYLPSVLSNNLIHAKYEALTAVHLQRAIPIFPRYERHSSEDVSFCAIGRDFWERAVKSVGRQVAFHNSRLRPADVGQDIFDFRGVVGDKYAPEVNFYSANNESWAMRQDNSISRRLRALFGGFGGASRLHGLPPNRDESEDPNDCQEPIWNVAPYGPAPIWAAAGFLLCLCGGAAIINYCNRRHSFVLACLVGLLGLGVWYLGRVLADCMTRQ